MDKMPVLDVCHNRAAHKDPDSLFVYMEREFYVVRITIPISGDCNDGVEFELPRPALTRELLRHDAAKHFIIRHTLCPLCRAQVDADIEELIGEKHE